jgi:hypothetical protein
MNRSSSTSSFGFDKFESDHFLAMKLFRILHKFPYLTYLDIECTHFDYIELFLLKQNMHLPRLLKLKMEYKSLTIITNNFTNDETHFNFGTIKYLDFNQLVVYPEFFLRYFPLL